MGGDIEDMKYLNDEINKLQVVEENNADNAEHDGSASKPEKNYAIGAGIEAFQKAELALKALEITPKPPVL